MDDNTMKPLTPEQKMEMSLEQIIQFEKIIHDWNTATSLENSEKEATNCGANKNMFDRTKKRHSRTESSDVQMSLQLPQRRNRHFNSRANFNLPMYRKRVQNAVHTLVSGPWRSRQRYRPRPYDRVAGSNDIAVSFQNDYGQPGSSSMVDNYHYMNPKTRDEASNLELPVRRNMDIDLPRVPRFCLMGTKIVVSRHSIKNKLNNAIQDEVKEIYETKGDRQRLHLNMEVCPLPHFTRFSLSDRFSING